MTSKSKACLHCGELISELASICPKCKVSQPFDSLKKSTNEYLEAEKKAAEIKKKTSADRLTKALHGKYKCLNSECPTTRDLGSIFKSRTCPNCGYPDTRPTCTFCSEKTAHYDDYRQSLVCEKHLAVPCMKCGVIITDGPKWEVTKEETGSSGFCSSERTWTKSVVIGYIHPTCTKRIWVYIAIAIYVFIAVIIGLFQK